MRDKKGVVFSSLEFSRSQQRGRRDQLMIADKFAGEDKHLITEAEKEQLKNDKENRQLSIKYQKKL